MIFEVYEQLPAGVRTQIEHIESIPENFRSAQQVAFLTARAPYFTNEVLSTDSTGLITKAAGETVPQEYAGFKKGALFIDKSAEDQGLYANAGDEVEALFELVLTDIDEGGEE